MVEIDESKFGRRKYHRGHRVKGQWVLEAMNGGRDEYSWSLWKKVLALVYSILKLFWTLGKSLWTELKKKNTKVGKDKSSVKSEANNIESLKSKKQRKSNTLGSI